MRNIVTPFTIVSCLFCLLSASGQTQQPTLPQTNRTQAAALIAQALNSAGGAAIMTLKDFTSDGVISFYSGGEEIQSTVRILARGQDQFRLDAYLPKGTRSWAVNHGSGKLRQSDGNTLSIPPHNAMTLGSLTFPYLRLVTAFSDKASSLGDMGEVTIGDQKLHKLHVHREFDSSFGADNPVNHLLDADYLFDPKTHLLVSVQNQTHPIESMASDAPHEIQFSDYRNTNGIMIPFGITEYVGGQRVWKLQLSSIQFNTGLSDSEFTF